MKVRIIICYSPRYVRGLLREIAGLHKCWLTQASIDVVKDTELLDLMEQSGCIGIFLGIESLDDADLRGVHKRQNKTAEYRDAIDRLHERGICVMAGFISGFDDQTPETIVATARRLNAVGIDVPFFSVLTPFRGTPLYDEQLAAGRILRDRDWPHCNGYNVAFRPARMTPDELLRAHRTLWSEAFGSRAVAERLARGATQLGPGGMMLSGAMNGFYGLKRLSGNRPLTQAVGGPHRIAHEQPAAPPMVPSGSR